MKRKYRLLIILLIVSAGTLVWLFRFTRSENTSPMGNSPESSSIGQKSNSFSSGKRNHTIQKNPLESAARKVQREWQTKHDVEEANNEWRAPINFYGKVVDENDNLVQGVDIDFSWNNLSGSPSRKTNSDAHGLFSLEGEQGKFLSVRVNKDGYYAYKPFGEGFFYAGENQNFIPDPNSPVVFHVRKKGEAEPLVRFRKTFHVPKDGTPVVIDLATGTQEVKQTSLKVECWTNDEGKRSGEKYDWKCRISVPGGGLQFYNEEFPFLAPDMGYIPTDEIDMTVKPNLSWGAEVERHYFIHTADGKFGRLIFRMIAGGDHFCLIESYWNPSGSRNLEFDPSMHH
jgi:hypothetical protein